MCVCKPVYNPLRGWLIGTAYGIPQPVEVVKTMLEDAMSSAQVEESLGVNRNYLRYHKDLFKPESFCGRMVYSRTRVFRIYLKNTYEFPDAAEDLKIAAKNYTEKQLVAKTEADSVQKDTP